jgi:hypothetical protein
MFRSKNHHENWGTGKPHITSILPKRHFSSSLLIIVSSQQIFLVFVNFNYSHIQNYGMKELSNKLNKSDCKVIRM